MNKKNVKKVLALALGFVMTLGLMPGIETKTLTAKWKKKYGAWSAVKKVKIKK